MARIEIEKKSGPPVLPIVLGLLALVAIVAAVFMFTGNGDDTVAAPGTLPHDTAGDPWATGAAAGADSPAEVRQFRQNCADQAQFRDDAGAEYEHEAECMRQLAGSLDAVTRQDMAADQPLQQRITALRDRADQINRDPQVTDHANRVRAAALEAVQIFRHVAAERDAPGADLEEHTQRVREAANQIEPGTALQEQRDRTAQFFSRAADALDALARSPQTQPR
jgi:hypothetical protein